MAKVPDIIPITDLRQDAAAALKRLRSSKQPVVITQRGRAAAVLLSLEAYERREHASVNFCVSSPGANKKSRPARDSTWIRYLPKQTPFSPV